MRRFCQIYSDAECLNELFKLKNVDESKILAAVITELANLGIERFVDDGRQYKFYLKNAEVKISKTGNCKAWLQVSAEDFDTADRIYNRLMNSVALECKVIDNDRV